MTSDSTRGGRQGPRGRLLLCAAVAGCLFAAPGVHAQARYRLLLDPGFSSAPMAEDLLSAHRALYAVENQLLPPLLFPEDSFLPKAGGMLYRLGKTVLLDNIVDHLTILTQHEVFGHGARYREFGSWDNRYHLSLFPPFGQGSGWAQSDVFSKTLSDEEHILSVAAGNEANTLLSLSLRRKWLERGRIDFRETVLYSFAAQNITWYILRTRFGDSGSGDIAVFLTRVNALHASTGAALTLDDLAWSCLANLLDPFQYYAIIGYMYAYLFGGLEYFDLPLIDFGAFRYLPAAHFCLSPLGVEFYLDNYFRCDSFLLSASLRSTPPTFGFSGGLNLELSGLVLADWISLNGSLDVWYQPALGYGVGNTIMPGFAGLGILAAAGLDVYFTDMAGLTAQAGFKTEGWVAGRPLAGGFFFSAGISFREK
jgi:hypothetical protein